MYPPNSSLALAASAVSSSAQISSCLEADSPPGFPEDHTQTFSPLLALVC